MPVSIRNKPRTSAETRTENRRPIPGYVLHPASTYCADCGFTHWNEDPCQIHLQPAQ